MEGLTHRLEETLTEAAAANETVATLSVELKNIEATTEAKMEEVRQECAAELEAVKDREAAAVAAAVEAAVEEAKEAKIAHLEAVQKDLAAQQEVAIGTLRGELAEEHRNVTLKVRHIPHII